MERRQNPGRLLGLGFPQGPTHLKQTSAKQFLAIERGSAREQFIKKHTQTVNIAPRVHIQPAHLRLFRAHVSRCANQLLVCSKKRLLSKPALDCLGNAKVNNFGHRHTIVHGDENVGWFNIAMDDPLLVGMLNRVADLDEEFKPLPGVKVVFVTILRDFDSSNEFHDKVGAPRFGCSRIQHPGDIRVLHHRERLPLRVKAGDDTFGVHPQLDNFERDLSADRHLLFRHVNRATTTFSDSLQQFVAINVRANQRIHGFLSLGFHLG